MTKVLDRRDEMIDKQLESQKIKPLDLGKV